MMIKIGTNASTGPSTKDSASGGRKTNAAVAGNPTHEGGLTDAPVLVGVSGEGTVVTFSDDVQAFSSTYVTEWSEEEEELTKLLNKSGYMLSSTDGWSSDEETESEDEEDVEFNDFIEERRRILADALSLKSWAVAYGRPADAPVLASPTATGRCYFDRPSAPLRESDEDADDVADILADAKALGRLAADYARPGPVEVSPEVFGRNYFDRASAPEVESKEEADERARILADAAALKELATDYSNVNKPVAVDPVVFGRCYFDRPSAVEQEEDEFADERAEILADCKALKELATDYSDVNKPVAVDPTVFGRNYFDRASADDTETYEEAEERAQILADCAKLQELATDYSNPSKPIVVDPAVFGRCVYSDADMEEDEFADERAEILADCKALKELATDYSRPGKPIEVDPAVFGRDYFKRPSAPEFEDEEMAAICSDVSQLDERHRILADCRALKELATDYSDVNKPIVVDPAVFGRCYFNRASADETEEDEYADERAEILADCRALKELATDYSDVNKPVVVDPAVFGRSYFNRPSADETETYEEAEERAQVLADAAKLKDLATDYSDVNKPLAVDPSLFGRGYYERDFAVETETVEEAEERAAILADAAKLKESAESYLRPEKPVAASSEVFGRNYFDRASAPEVESKEEADERARILADAAALKELATDYSRPEKPVTVDPAVFGRCYFDRPSAMEVEAEEPVDEQAELLVGDKALKNLAAAVKNAGLPGSKAIKTSSADTEVGAAKKSASSVNLFGLSEVEGM